MNKLTLFALSFALATCQMPLRNADAQTASEPRWEADCRRGYIRKIFPNDYSGDGKTTFTDGIAIDIKPEEFAILEKAMRDIRKSEKFWQCINDRDAGKLKHCYDNDRRWRGACE